MIYGATRSCVVEKLALCIALALLSSTRLGQAQMLTSEAERQASVPSIRPFKAHVPDRVLTDLKRRLAETIWPDQLPGTSWEYGADIKKVRELADYWQTKYNWRAQEARINRFHQYVTEIDGQQIHFIHERSPRPDAIPLLLIHGWPGSILEFMELIDPLTRPTDSSMPAFNVVIPPSGFRLLGTDYNSGLDPETHGEGLHCADGSPRTRKIFGDGSSAPETPRVRPQRTQIHVMDMCRSGQVGIVSSHRNC